MPIATPIDDMLDEGEVVDIVAHRHWIAIAVPVASGLALGAIGSFLLYFTLRYPDRVSDYGPVPMLILAALALYCLAVALIYAILVIQAANALILTNKSVYFLSQNGLLGRDVKQLGYDKIENVSYEKSGLLASTFDYGDLNIVTAGETENIVFHKAPNPSKLSDLVADRSENADKGQQV